MPWGRFMPIDTTGVAFSSPAHPAVGFPPVHATLVSKYCKPPFSGFTGVYFPELVVGAGAGALITGFNPPTPLLMVKDGSSAILSVSDSSKITISSVACASSSNSCSAAKGASMNENVLPVDAGDVSSWSLGSAMVLSCCSSLSDLSVKVLDEMRWMNTLGARIHDVLTQQDKRPESQGDQLL